jgi:hypothetical protein
MNQQSQSFHSDPQALESRFFTFGRREDGSYRMEPQDLPAGMSMIGTGQIGGKARGLVFAMRHIELGEQLTEHQHLLRFPDSTVIATDVYDAFLSQPGLADAVRKGARSKAAPLDLADKVLSTPFPDEWREALLPLLQRETRPLVVRSSSVMEDDPQHSFAGIYQSEFLPNRGSIGQRLDELVASVRRVYASTFGPNARAYRRRHDLDWRQEKMAVLIQNMIGSQYSHSLYYPLVSGVAFSHNFYPWTTRLRPEDGVVRLVVGTGTRAVGREYARVFSPGMPGLRPEGNDTTSIVRYSQETVDVLDLAAGHLSQRKLNELANPLLTRICSVVGSDGTLTDPLSSSVMLTSDQRFVASFSRLIEGSLLMPFTPLIRELLHSLRELLQFPVDIEFALDFSSLEASDQGSPLFFVLQVRPLGNRPEHRRVRAPKPSEEATILTSHHVLGNGVLRRIRHLVFVDPAAYRWENGYAVARAVGRVNERLAEADEPYILIGPGRWASSNPQLGVPVQYGEIAGASAIVEMSTARLAPELSYGTHFYADMVGTGVLYLPFNSEKDDTFRRVVLDSAGTASEEDGVIHYEIPEGIDVFVDGTRRKGVIALHRSSKPVKTQTSHGSST